MGLGALQARLETLLQGVRHPRVGAGLALAEESGELCKLLLEREVYGAEVSPEAIGGELVDVLICLCEIASQQGVDLEAAARAKLASLEPRVATWERELGPQLARARERMDGGC